ncbi:DUF6441 family protein [Sphingomonas solaris]|uniref:HK97 gp10 family phage protein n=1 Tax=Alterirhizorhabdus solaris TaxID=2529389 RepID=A0A558R863_9SPHN|nr:DUF6441 family protein [Sphingomonas solaris]TVV75546.1 hypothetical protein FOY91_06710 [Sphingomonas solaris]
MPNILDALTIDFAKLGADRKRVEKAVLEAERAAVAGVGKDAERALEAATAAGGLGKLAKAWNSQIYPKTGLAQGPAVLLYPKGGDRTKGAIRGQVEGGRIGARSGQTIAVPTKAAALSLRKRRPTPAEWEAATGIKLVPVERPGKPTLLVAAGIRLTKAGRVRGASATAIQRGRFASAVIFVLVPSISLRSRFSVEGTLRPYGARVANDFAQRASRIA